MTRWIEFFIFATHTRIL